MRQLKLLFGKWLVQLVEFLIKKEKNKEIIKKVKYDLKVMKEMIKPVHERDDVMIYLDSLGLKK